MHFYKKKQMEQSFDRVLVLTDFSDGDVHAAEEAARIASKFNGELHLLFFSYSLQNILTLKNLFKQKKEVNYTRDLQIEKTKIDLERRFGINIKIHTIKGHIKESVIQYTKEQKIDLVVLNVKKKKGVKDLLLGNVTKNIIHTVESEVLCVCPESDCARFKKIVLPVEGSIPKRKIRIAYELTKRFASSIHLVSLNDPANNAITVQNTKVLLDTFRYFKDITNTPIECKTIAGATIAEAAVNYAKKNNADLIIVNSGAESHWSRNLLHWWRNDIVNWSSVPVWKVQSLLMQK